MENQNSSLNNNNKLEAKTPDIEDELPSQNLNNDEQDDDQQAEQPPREANTRTPFTNLSQIDADLALARTLQEQERAYMMLMMNNDGSSYGSWETGSYHDDDDDDDDEDGEEEGAEEGEGEDFNDSHTENDDINEDEFNGTDVEDDEDEFHVHDDDDDDEDDDDDDDDDEDDHDIEIDPEVYSSDEAYARALQDAEEREMAARLFALAGISDRHIEEIEDHIGHAHDAWDEVDPDELSYEELLALGDVVGHESRGLSADKLSSLPSINYKAGSTQNGSNDSCVICRMDYEDSENLTLLSCKHSYHPECINNWLKINKVCPVCSTEVSTSGHS